MPKSRELQLAIAVQAAYKLECEGNRPPNAAPKTQPNVANMQCTSLQKRRATLVNKMLKLRKTDSICITILGGALVLPN